MDAATIREKIETVWEQLPLVFTLRDVLRTAGIPKNDGRMAHDILGGMVDDGRLFASMLPPTGARGRWPVAWSKEPCGAREEVLVALVREALPKLPQRFSTADLLDCIRMPRRMQSRVLPALTRLVVEGAVARVPPWRERKRLVRNCWTADAHLMAEEAALEARRKALYEDNPLSRSWNPATFEDPIARLSLPDPAKLNTAK